MVATKFSECQTVYRSASMVQFIKACRAIRESLQFINCPADTRFFVGPE